MKVFATSDLHGNLDDLDPSGNDIVVIAGDFADLNGFSVSPIDDQINWIRTKFIPWIETYPSIQFVIVPGNHDLCFDHDRFPFCESSSIHWPKNSVLLIDRAVEVDGMTIYGTPWVPIISYSWAFEADHDKLINKFSQIPDNVDILVTHTPPHITDCNIDRSLQFGGRTAFGSSELTDAIVRKKPRYVFCGHIHSGAHGDHSFDDSVIYNVSRLDENYEIAYKPTIVHIDEEESK